MSSTALHSEKETHCQPQQQHTPEDAVVAASSSAAGVWAGLTEVERTSLLVAFARWQGAQQHAWPDGSPWYTDPLGAYFVRSCIPTEAQQRMLDWAKQRAKISNFVAVRTAELDAQIAAALGTSSSSGSTAGTGGPAAAGEKRSPRDIQQMVLLGAGTDTRAWRLSWPPGFKVFEVDSAAVLSFKAWVLSGAAAAAAAAAGASGEQQQQQQQQVEGAVLPQLRCEQRVEVVADASQPAELWGRLLSCGLDGARPVVWLLEGFIGYLTVPASNALLTHLAAVSAPGSRVLITAPPTPDRLGEAAAADTEAAVPAGAAAAAAEAPKLQLHHSTFEAPTETLNRLAAAGWRGCQLLTEQQLAAKYQVVHAQPILIGSV
ncbi:S-adenosyl-L-methionine-dependent methyltransferase [Scenedesmus sp. NREL 46B-D3]|nr:S-adenosyl-L-methionine-dependent methyltransferase [Scenedesmus sp. NREL 46B-D3]